MRKRAVGDGRAVGAVGKEDKRATAVALRQVQSSLGGVMLQVDLLKQRVAALESQEVADEAQG